MGGDKRVVHFSSDGVYGCLYAWHSFAVDQRTLALEASDRLMFLWYNCRDNDPCYVQLKPQ